MNLRFNFGFSFIFTGIWLIANVTLFTANFFYYKNAKEYFYLRHLVGDGLPWARASAECLNLNCMLVIFPICRNLILTISLKSKCCYPVYKALWKNIRYHKLFAYGIIFFSIIHTFAHTFNYASFYDGNLSSEKLVSILTHLPANETHVNPIQELSHDLIFQTLKTIPGHSGLLLFIILIMMLSSSSSTIRKRYHELFWYSHHLFILFYIFLLIHGIQGIITRQINLDENDPESCSTHPQDWSKKNSICKIPKFSSNSPQTWKWILLPILLYAFERSLRFIRSWQSVVITKIITHPSSVLELRLRKDKFEFRTGQYIYIQCPSISFFEWHPFTLTSAPQDSYFSVHIRQAGDWTENLISKFTSPTTSSSLPQYPRIAIDGPYGTPCERIFDYEVVMLIGAGIGVTPFASVLKTFLRSPVKNLQQIQFFWLCPQPQAFEWFAEMLQDLEHKLLNLGNGDAVCYNIYLTKGWNRLQAWNIFLHENETSDVLTGLQQKTNYGRPNWDQIFISMKEKYLSKRVGVFCCGPKSLSKSLSRKCKTFSGVRDEFIKFEFYKEHF